ncbi:tyrosine-type recombinase/integrase [Nitrospirillum bahiense]|uniref:Phage integrase family protein n=1 Tax=Nitrospirillum amazonense TaxID=28077 RepID=A0A560EXM9_9PROT|nr:tyrosine-type recombinase/integrase [Nitrospirillum amazonense]TWB14131.1 phage integrase family protein [Nitrospirillum amazonense]
MIVMDQGERLPLLIDEDGVPLFRPTQWIVTARRAANLAANTLQANCYTLKFLYLWAAAQGVDVEARMVSGDYLCPAEISSLATAAQKHLDELDATTPVKLLKPTKVVSLEQVRMRAPPPARPVQKDTAANRLRTVADYLRWLGEIGNLHLDLQTSTLRQDALGKMTANLTMMIPKNRGRNVVGKREAPPQDVIDRLLAVIEPGAPDNPWTDFGLQSRNKLLIHMFYGLGIRRGEALGIKITDHIDFQRKHLLIARNADDAEDPRRQQPLAKTRDRLLPLKDGLIDMIQDYIIHTRRKVPNAPKHQFLFVSHQSGRPLSLSGGSRVFEQLRQRTELPDYITSHVLRHAWNSAFSSLIDAKGYTPEREAQMRSQMMGWSPTSGTAATYNRRKIREDAERFSLQHQSTLVSNE